MKINPSVLLNTEINKTLLFGPGKTEDILESALPMNPLPARISSNQQHKQVSKHKGSMKDPGSSPGKEQTCMLALPC